MRKLSMLVVVVVFCCSSIFAFGKESSNRTIIIKVNYGDVQPERTAEVLCTKGMTVLSALQSVADVETKPVKQYVFVTSIDGVKGKRGEMGWYYKIDGRSADKLAYNKVIDGHIKQIEWVYQKDVCSCKVDNKK